jgi:hypothetical protein
MSMPDHDPHIYDPDNYCPVCAAEMVWADCWQCGGAGGWHDCGEDCCPCLDKEEITVDCDECGGEGGYLQCAALPHTDEQMADYRSRLGAMKGDSDK